MLCAFGKILHAKVNILVNQIKYQCECSIAYSYVNIFFICLAKVE